MGHVKGRGYIYELSSSTVSIELILTYVDLVQVDIPRKVFERAPTCP